MACTWETHPSFAPIFWLMLVLCAHRGCSGAPGHLGCLELGTCKGNNCEHRFQAPVSLSFHFFRINSQECGSGWMLSICFIFKETGRVIFRAAVPSHVPWLRKRVALSSQPCVQRADRCYWHLTVLLICISLVLSVFS